MAKLEITEEMLDAIEAVKAEETQTIGIQNVENIMRHNKIPKKM